MEAYLKELEESHARLTTLVDRLCDDIEDLPDNPDIQRIGDSTRCFTMKSSALFAAPQLPR